VTPFAGMPGMGGLRDGVASSAWFFLPHGVVVDSLKVVYVADSYNNAIRKISLGNVNAIPPCIKLSDQTSLLTFVSCWVVGMVSTLVGGDQTNVVGMMSWSLNNPTGLFLSATGTMLVADNGNNAIRQIAIIGGG
jgi:DNA-binding beta-propeller fold protein YncE